MSWLIHRWFPVFCGLSLLGMLVFQDCQSSFIRHTDSGRCIKAGQSLQTNRHAYRYFAEMVDNCLNDYAQFRYSNMELLINIKTGGTFLSGGGGSYQNRFVMYKGKPQAAIDFSKDTQHYIKQTSGGSLFVYGRTVCAEVSGDYVMEKKASCSDSRSEKFTFGSVTEQNTKMKDVNCSSIQRMVIKRFDYGDFKKKNGEFNPSPSIDEKCSSLSACKVKHLCGGKESCELTVNNGLLSHYCTYHTSKVFYTKYTCVDINMYKPSITKTSSIRLSDSPNEGFIEIKNISTWIKVYEENWDIKHFQNTLCQHLGFNDTKENGVGKKQLGTGEDIATGDLIFYNYTLTSGSSSCIYLQPSKAKSNIDMPYATCKICDKPLLLNVTTFPDTAFSWSSSGKYKDARFSNDGWCASGAGPHHLLIDLQKYYHITQVVTFADKDQTRWSESYSLKYSHNKTLVDQSNIQQIKGNQNGYQASFTPVDIYNVRYLKIQSTDKSNNDFCLRIELCGEVQLPPVENFAVKPSNFSVHLSWKIPGPKKSSNITHFIIFLNGKEYQTISREIYRDQFTLRKLKPYTEYIVGIQTQDGSLQKSGIVSKKLKTTEAVPSGPPSGVEFKFRSKDTLSISWIAPDKTYWNGELRGYQICYSTSKAGQNLKCSTTTTSSVLSYNISNLQPSTKYFLTVAAGTKVGYGNKSLEISKITNGEPVKAIKPLYSSLSFEITKPPEYIKGVMVVVQSTTRVPTPSEDIETSKLKPYNASMQDHPYVTAYLKAEGLPSTFVIGDGKEYKNAWKKYINQPLKQKSNYVVFLRFFETQDLFYSTEWSSIVKTISTPVVSGPPINIVLKSRGQHSLEVSWKAPPDDNLQTGVLTGYQVCYSTRIDPLECLEIKSTNVFSLHIQRLRPSTKYFVTVAAGTKAGYGEKSLEISKVTNGEPVNPVTASYYSLAVYIPKPAEQMKEVMVIVQIATSNPTPSEDIETNELKLSSKQDSYVTAYLKTDVLPLNFMIGDGKEYDSENEKYINQPLKNDSNYIVFLRFFESQDSYYSTEWSSRVKTMVRPPVDHSDCQNSELSSDDETRMDLLIPLVIVSLCFLIFLVVFIYYYAKHRRRLQNKNEQPSHESHASKVAEQRKKFDSIQEPGDSYESMDRSHVNVETAYATPDEAFGQDKRNSTQSKPGISIGQETSDYMSLNNNRETENVYQPLEHPTSSANRHHAKRIDHRDQAMQYNNPAFNAYSNDD